MKIGTKVINRKTRKTGTLTNSEQTGFGWWAVRWDGEKTDERVFHTDIKPIRTDEEKEALWQAIDGVQAAIKALGDIPASLKGDVSQPVRYLLRVESELKSNL